MIVCGTGHRPNKLGGYGKQSFGRLVYLAHDWLGENKPDKVVSGMALGWDQALAVATVNYKIPLIAAIPFEGQETAWPKESQDYFHRILKRASEIKYVCEPGYASWKMQERNKWMCDNSDLVLALWDGSSGGTGNCIEYAKKQDKKIVNLYDKWYAEYKI
jgi:uncharacterized phage-like protein YoqJ